MSAFELVSMNTASETGLRLFELCSMLVALLPKQMEPTQCRCRRGSSGAPERPIIMPYDIGAPTQVRGLCGTMRLHDGRESRGRIPVDRHPRRSIHSWGSVPKFVPTPSQN